MGDPFINLGLDQGDPFINALVIHMRCFTDNFMVGIKIYAIITK